MLKQKKIFSEEECNLIVNLDKIDKREWIFPDRSYTSFILKQTDLTDWFFKKLMSFFETESGINIQSAPNYFHYHTFQQGDFFLKHNDTNKSRLYSIGCLLNNDFDGGEFKLYNDEEVTLEKTIGNAYIFDVRIQHEITKITKGTRHSLILFLDNKNVYIERNKLI